LTTNWVADSVAVGVPLITPAELRLRPTADRPLPEVTLQVYPVPVPPLATRVAEYAVPSVALGKLVVVTVRLAFTAMVRLALVVLLAESFTWTVNVAVPVAVGVPEMTPPLDTLNCTALRLLEPEVTLHV
jgi:hypothetical protein